jgi:hypothetical protein
LTNAREQIEIAKGLLKGNSKGNSTIQSDMANPNPKTSEQLSVEYDSRVEGLEHKLKAELVNMRYKLALGSRLGLG